MKTSYEFFSKYKKENFKKLKTDYESAVKKARNKNLVSNEYYNSLSRTRYNEVQTELGENKNILLLIKDEMDIDIKKDFSKLFNNKINKIPTKNKKKTIALLAELDAMNDFFEYWNTHELNSLKKEEVQTKEKILWKGNNETEFIQLIYMLYHSKLLSNESREITKLVKQVAKIFNLELGNNWESNLSNSIGRRNTDYKPQIISKLNNAWEEYSALKLDKKKKN